MQSCDDVKISTDASGLIRWVSSIPTCLCGHLSVYSLPRTSLSAAAQLATALDTSNFDEAERLLAPDCIYTIQNKRYDGAATIVDAYRSSDTWAQTHIDCIEYDSSLQLLDDGRVEITYLDRLAHEHRCIQVLTFNEDDRVVHIEHIDIEGEPEALKAFFDSVGLKR